MDPKSIKSVIQAAEALPKDAEYRYQIIDLGLIVLTLNAEVEALRATLYSSGLHDRTRKAALNFLEGKRR